MLLLFSPFAILEEGLVSLLMLIDAKIYGLVAELYSLYLELAMARIFDTTSFDSVIKNVYVLFGVVALFIVAFSLLQAMVNPDDVAKGTKTIKDIVKRMVLCVGATCLVPFVFDFLYDFQYSLLSFQVIPKTMIGISSTENVNLSGEYINDVGENQKWESSMTASDLAKSGLKLYGNQMAFFVLNGFLQPNDNDGDGILDNVKADASKYFNTETGIGMAAGGCILGVLVTAGLAITGVGVPAAATTALGTAGICAGGIAVGVVVNGALMTLTAEDFYWNEVTQYFVIPFGDFDYITAFAGEVVKGTMTYTPIISTVAGIILLYMLFSFCLDLGVRAAKLVFYQIIAPISFLLSILPKNKDLMSNWFKLVISTWAEVFVRIICVCGAALLISNLNFTELNNFGLIGRAIIVLGVVAFAKQAPKLFSEVTGIKSGNMKLGIKDKLKEGGLFTAADKLNRFAAGTASMISGHGNPLAFRRGWKNGWSNVGGEVQRRQEKKDALAAGATRTQIMKDSIRKKFGFVSEAEANLRDIDKGSEIAQNRSSYNIKGIHFDEKGNVYSGQLYTSDGKTVTYSDGKYIDSQGEVYTGTLYDSIGPSKKVISTFDSGAGIHYDSSGKIYSGQLYSDEGKTLSFRDGKYLDSDGNVYSGELFDSENKTTRQKVMHGFKIDSNTVESLEALKAQNISSIAGYSDQIRALDKSISYGGAQIKFKSNLKGEAEKKIDEAGSKVKGILSYDVVGADGSVERKTFEGTYAQIEEFVNRDLTPEQRQQVNLNQVRDDMIAKFIQKELDSAGDNKIKQDSRAGFSTIKNNGGYTYSYYKTDADGKFVLDSQGNKIVDTGKIEVSIDSTTGEYIVTDTRGDTTTTLSETKSTYEIVDYIDKLAKSSNGVLNDEKQRIDETIIDGFRGQNEAIDNAIKQVNEQKEAKRKSEDQRRKEASKKYTASRK